MVLVLSFESPSVVGHQVIIFALRFPHRREGDTLDAANMHQRADRWQQRVSCPGLAALGKRGLVNLRFRAPSHTSCPR